MDLGLSGKVVAVTGASRGVGLAIAEALAAEGAHVAIAARSPGDLAAAHGRIEAAGSPMGGHCLAYACDLATPGEAAAFVEACIETFGRLDGLVCNPVVAAGGGAPAAPAGREREAGFLPSLLHAIEALEAAAPSLIEARGAALFVAAPTPGAGGWHPAAARAALAEAARALAPAFESEGVRVNALLPGPPSVEGAGPAIAAIAALLVSPRSAAINGAAIPADRSPFLQSRRA